MKYNIAPAGVPAQNFTADQIRAAAVNWNKPAHLYAGKISNSIPCQIAAIVGGYVTAVLENGAIIQGWAGDFTIKEG